MAEVIFNKLEKVYSNGFKAVHGIDLKIADGEFMVIVGPSGCAKSTTLRMLAGLETISGGEVRIGDKIVNNLAPKSRGIAMVFQNYALYPHMTVRENLAFGLKLSKLPKAQIDRQVEEAAKILELEELLEENPSLRPMLPAMAPGAYRKARLWAANETQLDLGTFPTICPFGLEEMLDEDFWPD